MQNWLIWQLADSSYPAGGFAHSSGLEAAWQQGEVTGDGLADYIQASLTQLGHSQLPLWSRRTGARIDIPNWIVFAMPS